MENILVVEDYNESWPEQFNELKDLLWPAVKDLAIGIEHVGSTSVPGLSAKPIIDVDVITSKKSLLIVIGRIEQLGYEHLGDLGIEGREAFKAPDGSVPHHLYVCLEDCLALRNHILFRNYLRENREKREAYSRLKKDLVFRFGNSVEEYTKRKTDFILSVLALAGINPEELEQTQMANVNRIIE